ncbi:MAG: flavodoxin family protein [Thermodesulfovibrionia bacterium]|nr:flavodoxin family protein [Thermodesulfovibrionia bacterium]
MKVIAFLGSPRVKGNSELMLNEAIRAIEGEGHTVTVFRPSRMKISPCLNCGGCNEAGICAVDDDMEKVYRAIRGGERFIIASPVFFFGLTAQVKALIDRCQSFWCEKYLLKRPIPEGENGRKGLLMLVGGMKKEIGFKCCDATATAFFRTINVPEHDVLCYPQVDAKGAITSHPTALKDAFEAGKRLVS